MALSASLARILRSAGYEVDVVGDGSAALTALAGHTNDVVLLDIGLPFIDGWRVLAAMETAQVPGVIVISARGGETDKVRALDLGADDYLAKPFGAEELLARIRALVRRTGAGPPPNVRVEMEGVVIDLVAQSVRREGEEVRLSPTEYGLLAQLARRAGVVVDHRTLLSEVWGPSRVHERSYLRTFVQRLRLKLERDPHNPRLIVTVGSRGYRLGAASPD